MSSCRLPRSQGANMKPLTGILAMTLLAIVTGANGNPAANSVGYVDTNDSSVYVSGGNGVGLPSGAAGGNASAVNDGTSGLAEAWSGAGSGSYTGGVAYAECLLAEAVARGGGAWGGTGGMAEAHADDATAIGGSTANGGTGGVAEAYGDSIATAVGGA